MAPKDTITDPAAHAAEVLDIPVENVWASRVDGYGNAIVATASGNKYEITPAGETTVLMGPGHERADELANPAEPNEEDPIQRVDETDLPKIEDSAPEAPAAAPSEPLAGVPAPADQKPEDVTPDVTPPALVEVDHLDAFKGKDGKWYFRHVDASGDEIERSTDAYPTRKAARAAAHDAAPGVDVRNA